MVSIITLVISSVILRATGWLGVARLASWRAAVRGGLAAMFTVTGASHFSPMKYDFQAMIPEPLPNDLSVIYLTGVLEIAGAIGLLIPRLRTTAAGALILLLMAMFPANAHAALQGIPLRGEPPTPLTIRLPMQLIFIAALWWSSIKKPSAS
jgi:uncharacterized membrane protein